MSPSPSVLVPDSLLLVAQTGTTAESLSGLAGWVADVVVALGVFGVGVLVAVENLFPPIPSEVILPLAGYLASEGRLPLVLAVVAASIGSVLGAAIMYEAAKGLGWPRFCAFLTKAPLVNQDDLDRARDWFDRHGYGSVFFGRLVPGVRSLVSIPAGANEMPRLPFYGLTALGSTIWNVLLVGAGWILGKSWKNVESYSSWINLAIVGALVLATVKYVWDRRGRIADAAASSR